MDRDEDIEEDDDKDADEFNFSVIWWWASLICYCRIPVIFTFLSLSLHHWSTSTHPTNMTSHMSLHNHSHAMHHLCSIGLVSLTWWTDSYNSHVTFSFLSYPMHALPWPDQSQIIMPHGQVLNYGFATDEPCACFLVYHSHLTHLYLPFEPKGSFPPDFRLGLFCLTILPHKLFSSQHWSASHLKSSKCLVSPNFIGNTMGCEWCSSMSNFFRFILGLQGIMSELEVSQVLSFHTIPGHAYGYFRSQNHIHQADINNCLSHE